MDTPNPNKALWEKGDFTRIAAAMRDSGDALVERLDIRPGMQVLDLGCGDGTTAVPAAQRGAEVLGVDIARNLVEAGRQRVAQLGLGNCRFQEGDASDLRDLPDQRFDRVVTIFGAMFAPRPLEVAREMVRVTRPGGRIIMGNWIPGDPSLVARILSLCSRYTPPPPAGFVSPMTWGEEQHVRARFTAAGVDDERIRFNRETYWFRFDGSPQQLLATFRDYYGPTMNAYLAAEQSGRRDALHGELETLFVGENRSRVAGRTEIPATFLRVTVEV